MGLPVEEVGEAARLAALLGGEPPIGVVDREAAALALLDRDKSWMVEAPSLSPVSTWGSVVSDQ